MRLPNAQQRKARRATDRAIRLERQLVRIRWFGIAFGVFQVLNYTLGPDPGQALKHTAGFLKPWNFALFGLLALVNIAVVLTLRATSSQRTISRLGAGVFAADVLVLLGLAWVYSFDRYETTWVLFYVLALEGALRYQLRGALAPVIVALPIEFVRSVFRTQHYGYPFYVSSVTYRVGVMAIVAFVAGVMAKQLERERSQAEDLMERETSALKELTATHNVVLAGVRESSFDETIQSIVNAMAPAIGYDLFGVGLVETTPDGPLVRSAATHGGVGGSVRLGEGVCGRVAQTGQAAIVAERTSDVCAMADGVRSEVCVPIVSGDRVIGVIDVQSLEPDRFDQADVERLQRLAPQIGLVISNARLLAQERAMVSRLRELDSMKDDFIAITSHELRSPLTSIRGFVGTLRRKEVVVDDEQRDEYLAVIDRQTERLSRLVEDLLITSRIERGTLNVIKSPVDVVAATRSVIEELGKDAARVQLTAPDGLGDFRTDEQRLGQIVRNLVENALKFSPPESTVHVTVSSSPAPLTIEVRDEGVGISEEDLGRIFDRFYQVGGSMGRRGRGVGLGLYITRWLVEALGGEIHVTSTSGKGTTFTVSMPAEAATARSVRHDAIA